MRYAWMEEKTMKSYWRASLRAPDNTETCEVFEGEATDTPAWNAGQAWLLQNALPRMLAVSAVDGMDVTSHAHSRFTDALLSQSGDIVVWSDPWEMRLEHYPTEVWSETVSPDTTATTEPFLAGLTA